MATTLNLNIGTPVTGTFPLTVSANSRYLKTPGGVPFYMIGDSPYSLLVDLAPTNNSTTTDLGAYLTARKAQGFNAVKFCAIANDQTGGRADGSTYDGITPFTGTVGGSADITTPRASYWSRVDTMLQMISDYGMLAVVHPIDTQSWLSTMTANGSTRCNTYGQWIANRYAALDNILWLHGNDYQNASPANDVFVQAVATGINTVAPSDLQSVQLYFLNSDSLSDYQFGNGPSTWGPFIDFNSVYSYNHQYSYLRDAYNRASTMPIYLVEASFEHEQNGGAPLGDPLEIRRQLYWCLTNGSTGNFYGEQHVWPLLTGWETWVLPASSPGVTSVTKFASFVAAFNWSSLIPDQSNTFLTAGQGTLGTDFNYATAAKDTGGHLALVYVPFATNVTCNLSLMAGTTTCRWFDPVAGTYSSIGTFTGSHTFTHPGNNSGGDPDRILVLEA